MKGVKDGHLKGGEALEDAFLEKFTELRSDYQVSRRLVNGIFWECTHDLTSHMVSMALWMKAIRDSVEGRMPLVYAHFVQVLLDCCLFGAPLALFAQLGSMSIVCVGMLTVFYEGLLDLAKVLLE
jgi:hypothetical protein